MKKSFWGYNVQEVDESMDLLESAKLKLEKKVKTLTADLESTREELAAARTRLTASDTGGVSGELERKYRETEKEAASLRAEVVSLKAEVASLAQKNSQMAAQIATYDEQSMQNAAEQAGDICRAAYEDMANAKANSKAVLERFLDSFWERFNQYELKIRDLYEDVISANETSREGFLAAADDILTNYSVIRKQDERMKQRLVEVQALRDDAQREMAAVLGELSRQEKSDDRMEEEIAAEPEAEMAGQKYRYAILDELAALRRERQKAAEQAEEVAQATVRTAAAQQVPAQARQITTPFISRESSVHTEKGNPQSDSASPNGGNDGTMRIDVTMDVDKKNIV